MEYRLLGPLEVWEGDRSLSLPAGKPSALLALLLLHSGDVVSIEIIAEALWGERPPASAANAVQGYIAQLRRIVGREKIVTRSPGYLVSLREEDSLDLRLFEDLIRKGREALAAERPGEAAEVLGDALDLVRGTPLADFRYDAFAQPESLRLEELRLVCIETRLDAELAIGSDAELVGELEGLVAANPLRERLHGQLMLALYRSGRQAEALATYQESRRQLVGELGIEPSDELQALNRAILNQDPTLGVTTPVTEPKTNLPTPAARLVGRDRELDALGALFERPDVRLVTITGPGGVGKTRLLLSLAKRAVPRHRDGVFLVQLSSLLDDQLVLPTIARELRIDEKPSEPLVETLVLALRDKELLLALDNFEQVMGAAEALADLLASCPNLRVVVTSREGLRLSGEHDFPLNPLSLASAVVLFTERASAVAPGFADGEDVREICRLLDCLPLALELAAARVTVLSTDQILTRLDRRLSLLTGGARDSPARQQTMAAAIAWSHELLDVAERQLFARLSIFVGGCTLFAAEEACDATLDLLQSLVDKSLLRRRGKRFHMLETIREYGLEQLEKSGEVARFRQRHAEFFLAVAEEGERALRTDSQDEEFERLEDEIGNLRSACEWFRDRGKIDHELRLLGSLARFWASRGHVREGAELLNEALARRPSEGSVGLLRALGAAAWLAEVQGEHDLSEEWSNERVAAARALGEETELIHGLAGLAIARLNRRDVAGALGLFEEGVALARATGDTSCISPAIGNLAAALLIDGDYERSRPLAEESLALARDIGDARWIAASLDNVGWALLGAGEVDEAAACFREALELAPEFGVTEYPEFLEGLAAVALAGGDASRAAILLGAAQAFRSFEGLNAAWHVVERETRELEEARTALSPEDFDRAFSKGTGFSLEEAVSYALGEPPMVGQARMRSSD